MLEDAIPRLLAWVPRSLRNAIIGHPSSPSRIATFAHNLLNRLPPDDSQAFACQGVLKGFRMSVDWSRFRSFVYGTWEPEVVKTITAAVQPGMTVIDVGAHIGYYTLIFAKCVGPTGHVFSFEPFSGNFALLQKNVEINNLQNVRLHNQALFSRTERITISVPDDQPNPGTGSIYGQGSDKRYHVDAISLDDFCGESNLRPDILKMDVEGAEYDVLTGAQRTVSRFWPKLLIELHHFDGNLVAHPVLDLLTSWGYETHWVERWQLTSYILATRTSAQFAEDGPQV